MKAQPKYPSRMLAVTNGWVLLVVYLGSSSIGSRGSKSYCSGGGGGSRDSGSGSSSSCSSSSSNSSSSSSSSSSIEMVGRHAGDNEAAIVHYNLLNEGTV